MPIYTVNGNMLLSCYGLSSEQIPTAYNLDGEIVYQKSVPPTPSYPIENVVSYFRDSTQAVEAEINALSDDWQSVIHITDPHGSGNQNHSQAIALYLLANTTAKMIVLGGDYSIQNWSETQYDTYVSPFLQSDYMENIYACFGNHETYGTGATASAKSAIYSDFLVSKTLQGNPQDIYYYFDDVPRKTRFVFINTSDSNQTTMSSTQLAWLETAVQLPGTDWSVVVFGHVNIENLGGVTTMNESNGAAIAAAIATSSGTVVGYFCGHQHIDGISTISGFHQAMLYCDKLENIDYYSGYSVTDRAAGTTLEQAVSVISFNTTTKQVAIRRIGVESPNQTLAFSY